MKWGQSIKFLLELGCEKIESGVDHYCEWSDEELGHLQERFTEAFYIYKEYIQKEKKTIFWNLFDQQLESFLFRICRHLFILITDAILSLENSVLLILILHV